MTFHLDPASGASPQSLTQLGWQPRSDAPTRYELSANLEPVRAGEIVALAITDGCGLVVRNLFREVLEIGDATQRLRRFADTGRI